MIKKIKPFLLLLLLSYSWPALAQKEWSVFGKVIDKKSGRGLSSISVTNLRNSNVVVTNSNGDFYIRAAEGDSIIASSIGYGRFGIKWNKNLKDPILSLDQTAIALEEIIVKDKKSATLEKEIKDFLDNPTNAKTMRRDIFGNMLSVGTSNPSGGGMSISIDALYDLWSKEGKSKRKAAEFEYQDIKRFYVELRYNKRKVADITGLKDYDLDEFMKFCRLSDDFVLQATDYDLTYEIFKCYRQYGRSFFPSIPNN